MYASPHNPAHALLANVQARLPVEKWFLQEAFISNRGRPVNVRLAELTPDTFYQFDEMIAQAFCDAVMDSASQHAGGSLTISYPYIGGFQAQQRRLQQLAGKIDKIRVLAIGEPAAQTGLSRGMEFHDISHNPLLSYRIALKEGVQPLLFICTDALKSRVSVNWRGIGFFTFTAEIVENVADEIESLLRGMARQLATFRRLKLLHETTQQVARELERYARRMDLAIRQARRRPDLLTPKRFERIVDHAILKMEQLKKIPLRALRSIEKSNK